MENKQTNKEVIIMYGIDIIMFNDLYEEYKCLKCNKKFETLTEKYNHKCIE